MPDEQADLEQALRAIRLRAKLDRKQLKHLGDPDEEPSQQVSSDPVDADESRRHEPPTR